MATRRNPVIRPIGWPPAQGEAGHVSEDGFEFSPDPPAHVYASHYRDGARLRVQASSIMRYQHNPAGPFTVFGELFLCQLIFPFTYHILLHMMYSKLIFSSPLSIALTQSPDRRSICRFTWWNPRQLAPTSEYS